MIRPSGTLLLFGSLLALPSLGCVTHTGGTPLPSGHYLQHSPVYFAPDPAFPLQRERDANLDAKIDEPAPSEAQKLPPVPQQPEKKSLGKRIGELFAGVKPPAKVESAPVSESSIPSAIPASPAARSQSPDSPDTLQGSFVRESETGTLTMTFEEKRLKIRYAMKAKGQEKPLVTCAEADYSTNKLGQVYGVISSIDAPEAEGAKAVPFLLAAEREGDPFSFRTRLDDGVLTVSDWRINGASSTDADKRTAFRPFLGKFKRPEPPAPSIGVVPAGFPAGKPSFAPTTPNTIPPIRDVEVLPMPKPIQLGWFTGVAFPPNGQ